MSKYGPKITPYLRTFYAVISWISRFLRFLDPFFVFSKWCRSPICKSSCLKWISGMKLSPAYKKLFIISLTLYYYKKTGILLKDPAKLPNNRFRCCSLINLEFLLPQTSQFNESIIFPFFVFSRLRFLLSVIYLHFKQ